jgi:hypothetical protein
MSFLSLNEGGVIFLEKYSFYGTMITADGTRNLHTWRRLNPNRNGEFAYRDAGVGLQLRGHTCGPDNCS